MAQNVGLQRIGDPEDGTALWTTVSDPAKVKVELEKRAKQREVCTCIYRTHMHIAHANMHTYSFHVYCTAISTPMFITMKMSISCAELGFC